MKAVARGERHAPRDAGGISYSSIEALGRLLTRDNRALLATIRDRNPRSVAELSRISGRAESNLARTLRKLEVAGLVKFTKRSEEHTSELQSLMRISYAVFCLKKKKQK